MIGSVSAAASAGLRSLQPIDLPSTPLTPVQMGESLRGLANQASACSPLDPVANSMRGRHARDLTAGERAALQQAFGTSIDLSNVRIVNGAGWNPDAATALYVMDNPAITEGNTVYIRSADYRSDLSSTKEGTELLIHEFAHVRQFQQLGFARFGARYARETVQYGAEGSYEYGPRATNYLTETLEGQAQMAGHLASARWTLAHGGTALEMREARNRMNTLPQRMTGSWLYGL